MKKQHMDFVLDWRTKMLEDQGKYIGKDNCPFCKNPIESLPNWMVGEYDYCYSCYRELELQGIRPPKRAEDLLKDSPPNVEENKSTAPDE